MYAWYSGIVISNNASWKLVFNHWSLTEPHITHCAHVLRRVERIEKPLMGLDWRQRPSEALFEKSWTLLQPLNIFYLFMWKNMLSVIWTNCCWCAMFKLGEMMDREEMTPAHYIIIYIERSIEWIGRSEWGSVFGCSIGYGLLHVSGWDMDKNKYTINIFLSNMASHFRKLLSHWCIIFIIMLFDAIKTGQTSWLTVETDSRLVCPVYQRDLDTTAPFLHRYCTDSEWTRWQHSYPGYFSFISGHWEKVNTHHPSLNMRSITC